ncbi:MAG: hypothetical protein R3A13_10390 [Bdellovibrionota bacterium]
MNPENFGPESGLPKNRLSDHSSAEPVKPNRERILIRVEDTAFEEISRLIGPFATEESVMDHFSILGILVLKSNENQRNYQLALGTLSNDQLQAFRESYSPIRDPKYLTNALPNPDGWVRISDLILGNYQITKTEKRELIEKLLRLEQVGLLRSRPVRQGSSLRLFKPVVEAQIYFT